MDDFTGQDAGEVLTHVAALVAFRCTGERFATGKRGIELRKHLEGLFDFLGETHDFIEKGGG